MIGDTMTQKKKKAPPRRVRGKKPSPDMPPIPYEEMERLLIYGETVHDPTIGKTAVVYPSLRQLADRFGVSQTTVWKLSKRRNCLKRREEVTVRKAKRVEKRVVEMQTEARALAIHDELRLVDDTLVAAWEDIKKGSLKIQNIADLNVAIRLKKFLQGEVESRVAVEHGVGLEAIQARHKELMERAEVVGENESHDREQLLGGVVIDVTPESVAREEARENESHADEERAEQDTAFLDEGADDGSHSPEGEQPIQGGRSEDEGAQESSEGSERVPAVGGA